MTSTIARYCPLALLCWHVGAVAQIETVTTEANTILGAEILIYIEFSVPKGYDVDDERTSVNHQFDLRSLVDDKVIGGDEEVVYQMGRRRKGLTFKISGFKRDVIDNLYSKEVDYYLAVQDTIVVYLRDVQNEATKTIELSPALIRDRTATQVKLSEEQMKGIIQAAGGEIKLYKNKIDVGTKVKTNDSTSLGYVVSFAYAQPFLFAWNTLAVIGSVGTDETDPLNKVSLYPISVAILKLNDRTELEGEVGLEASQDFSLSRLNLNFYVQSIVPNFLDLSYGEKRLRLKPVVKVGGKGLFEWKDQRANEKREDNFEVFAELYYYVPIMDIYSLLVEGNAFWIDNTPDKVKSEFALTLGADVGETGFKVMAKFSSGTNDVNLTHDSRLILGVLMDIFEKR